jgi:hypothetical protein
MGCVPKVVRVLAFSQKRAIRNKADLMKENKAGKTALELAWIYDAKDGGEILGYLVRALRCTCSVCIACMYGTPVNTPTEAAATASCCSQIPYASAREKLTSTTANFLH